MTTTQLPTVPVSPDCPSREDLARMIDGNLPVDRQSVITDHLGECPECRLRIEEVATEGAPHLSDVVRHIDTLDPPKNSAYWQAMNMAERAIATVAYPSSTPSTGDLKLDFLQPADAPGLLGRISTFDVFRVVGRGGMGVVLHAFDPQLHRDIAIKMLDPQLANNETARQRFCREARAAAAVSHDNLVAVHQVNEDEKSGLPFLVMQFVNGESLEQRLKRVGRLSVPEVVRIGMQAAAGLAGAHAHGLIHRDIKPGNILIEAGTEKVKLTDFGLARAAEDLKLTRTGFVAGTPLYMAPEQARGDDIDFRADLFSLGSVLYEALAGKPPFEGKTPLAVLRRVADEAHAPLRRINRDVPIWLDDAIDRLLEKDPANRFNSATEVSEYFACQLAQIEEESAANAPISSGACGTKKSASALYHKRKHKVCWRTAASLAGVFGAGVISGVAGWQALMPPPRTSSPAAIVTPAVVTEPASEEGPEARTVLRSESGAIWAAAISRDGTMLAMGAENGRVSIWDVPNTLLKFDLHPEKSDQLPAHNGPVWAVDFAPDGKRLVTASDDGIIKVWDLNSGKQLKSLEVGRSIRSAAISPDGNWVAVGDRSGTVRVFDLLEDSEVTSYEQGSTVNGVAFSPKGLNLTLASVGTDGSVIVWDMARHRKRFSLSGHSGPVYSLSFSPDSDRLATAGWDQKVIIWDMQTGTKGAVIEKAHTEGVTAVRFAPCGRLLASAGQDGRTKIWDTQDATPKMLEFHGHHRGTIHALRFNVSGSILLTGGRDGSIRLWDVECLPKKK